MRKKNSCWFYLLFTANIATAMIKKQYFKKNSSSSEHPYLNTSGSTITWVFPFGGLTWPKMDITPESVRCVLIFRCALTIIIGISRISLRRANSQSGWTDILCCPFFFCRKLHENGRVWTQQGKRAHVTYLTYDV